MELIKIVNYGKSGTYLYAAIIKIENKYFWTESIFCKTKEEKKENYKKRILLQVD